MARVSRLISEDGSLNAHFDKLARAALGWGIERSDRGLGARALMEAHLSRLACLDGQHRLLEARILPGMKLAVAILEAIEVEEWGGQKAPEWPAGTEACLIEGKAALEGALRSWRTMMRSMNN